MTVPFHSVLFFTYWYPNKQSKNFAIFIKRHAQAIAEKNEIKVLAFTVIKGRSLCKVNSEIYFDENNVETHHIYVESVFNKLFYLLLPLHYFIISSYIKRHLQGKFNVIHSNIIFPCAIVGHWLAQKFKCKHFITEHWSKLDKFFKISAYKWLGRKAYNKAAGISCVSEFLAKNVRTYTQNKNICIIPNLVDNSIIYYKPDIEKSSKIKFIAVAHWSKPKNPFYFLDALAILKDKGMLHDFEINLVGVGEQIEQIKSKNYNFKINFLGNLSPVDLCLTYNQSGIFLHGSDYETFSVVMAEALSCGLPVIVSPVGVAFDIVNERNGFIADNNVNDWVVKIEKAIRINYNNLEIANAIKNRFGLDNIADSMNSFYKS